MLQMLPMTSGPLKKRPISGFFRILLITLFVFISHGIEVEKVFASDNSNLYQHSRTQYLKSIQEFKNSEEEEFNFLEFDMVVRLQSGKDREYNCRREMLFNGTFLDVVRQKRASSFQRFMNWCQGTLHTDGGLWHPVKIYEIVSQVSDPIMMETLASSLVQDIWGVDDFFESDLVIDDWRISRQLAVVLAGVVPKSLLQSGVNRKNITADYIEVTPNNVESVICIANYLNEIGSRMTDSAREEMKRQAGAFDIEGATDILSDIAFSWAVFLEDRRSIEALLQGGYVPPQFRLSREDSSFYERVVLSDANDKNKWTMSDWIRVVRSMEQNTFSIDLKAVFSGDEKSPNFRSWLVPKLVEYLGQQSFINYLRREHLAPFSNQDRLEFITQFYADFRGVQAAKPIRKLAELYLNLELESGSQAIDWAFNLDLRAELDEWIHEGVIEAERSFLREISLVARASGRFYLSIDQSDSRGQYFLLIHDRGDGDGKIRFARIARSEIEGEGVDAEMTALRKIRALQNEVQTYLDAVDPAEPIVFRSSYYSAQN